MKHAIGRSNVGKLAKRLTPFWHSLGVTEKADGTIEIPPALEREIRAFQKARPSLGSVQALAAFAHQKKGAQAGPGEITPAQLEALSKAMDAERRKNPFQTDTEIVENVRKKHSSAWNPWGVKLP